MPEYGYDEESDRIKIYDNLLRKTLDRLSIMVYINNVRRNKGMRKFDAISKNVNRYIREHFSNMNVTVWNFNTSVYSAIIRYEAVNYKIKIEKPLLSDEIILYISDYKTSSYRYYLSDMTSKAISLSYEYIIKSYFKFDRF